MKIKKSLQKNKINYFITSEPFHDINTGDYDYLQTFVKNFPKVTSDNITILKNETINFDFKQHILDNFTKSVSNKQKFLDNYYSFKNNPHRISLINSFINTILSTTKKDNSNILIIEYRAPETGIIFYPDDILLFKKNNIKVVLVCHEFYINVVRPYLKNITIKLCNKVDLVYFFNHIDHQEAVKFGFKNKYAYTYGLITLNIPKSKLIPTLERPDNILYFGLIRPNKGFLNALELGKLLYENKSNKKIYITGKCELDNPLIKDWIKRINSPIINQNLTVNSLYKKNIEIKINPTDQEIIDIVNQCQYAYKPDGKGYANNASSLLNLMYLGCILFTKSTLFTPQILLKNKDFNNTILFQNKLSTNVLNNKTPSPSFVLNKINQLSIEDKESILSNELKYLKEYHSPTTIIKSFIHDLLSNLFKMNQLKKTKNKKVKSQKN